MMDDLEQDSDVSTNQIIKGLLTSEDLEVKTEIHNPLAMSTLDVLGENIDKVFQQKVTARDIKELISGWNRWYRINMIPYHRQSRKEVVEAVTSVRSDESSEFAKGLLDKALGSQH